MADANRRRCPLAGTLRQQRTFSVSTKVTSMLVFISDLHLTDGTASSNLHPGSFHILVERFRYLAARASWRRDGSYRPIERIDMVLLGDILDLMRSQRWHEGSLKPWSDCDTPELGQHVGEICEQTLAANAASLAVLRAMVAGEAVWIPPGAVNGQPDYRARPQAVPVRIHYVVGNQDWMLHLPGPAWDGVRQQVVRQMGLANSWDQPFPHDPTESDGLHDLFRRYRVVARHGDVYDPLHFTHDASTSSVGDALVVQLLTAFLSDVQQELSEDAPTGMMSALRGLYQVRPVLRAPCWLAGLLEQLCPRPPLRQEVKQLWDRRVEQMLESEPLATATRGGICWREVLPPRLLFRHGCTTSVSGDLSAGYALEGLLAPIPYARHARAESDIRNRRAWHVVYGHTHQEESVPLEASYADGSVWNQWYFNCGTWQRVHRPAQGALSSGEFLPAETMQVLSLFEGDQRSGRPFENWTGLLGVSGTESVPPQRRVSGRLQRFHAPVSGIRPPHFQPAAGRRTP